MQRHIHFVGANGFPSRCYIPLLKHIEKRFRENNGNKSKDGESQKEKEEEKERKEGSKKKIKEEKNYLNIQRTDVHRSHHYESTWQPSINLISSNIEKQLGLIEEKESRYNYHIGAEDKECKKSDKKIIGFGHSMGGAMLYITAAQKPHLFKRIIVWDPPMFSLANRFLFSLISLFPSLMKYHPLIQATYRKRQEFKSKEEALSFFSSRRLFKKFPNESLENLIIPIEGDTEGEKKGQEDEEEQREDRRELKNNNRESREGDRSRKVMNDRKKEKNIKTKVKVVDYKFKLDFNGEMERFFYLTTPYDIFPNFTQKGDDTKRGNRLLSEDVSVAVEDKTKVAKRPERNKKKEKEKQEKKQDKKRYFLGQYTPLDKEIELIFIFSSQHYLQKPSDIAYLKRSLSINTKSSFLSYDGSHFYPLEDNEGTYSLIKEYLE